MPFGYSDQIFPHPAVEYIPLLPLKILDFQYQSHHHQPWLYLYTGQMSKNLLPFKDQIQALNLYTRAEMGLILLNASLETIKYRGNYITVIIRPESNKHQAIKILTHYFYKSNLLFQLIDAQGTQYCQQSWELPKSR